MKTLLAIIAIIGFSCAAILASDPVISRVDNTTIQIETTKSDIVRVSVDSLVKREAELHEEYAAKLAVIRTMISEAKKAGVEPSAAVAEIAADNEAKAVSK